VTEPQRRTTDAVTQEYIPFGRLFAGQNAAPGDYSDVVTVTLLF